MLIWVVLITLTLLSFYLGHSSEHVSHTTITMAILLLSFFKVRMVIVYFMEVKDTPLLLRCFFELWCITVCAALIVIL
ncbi:cytochrome C oxidase subunit IV family protein [Thalassotalea psychrophila]|uniref:cytochrome C oxidase subunit IV family protein n=1 Tax=Thalassotalea psychrophila TaxID=3065647 RepID=UPI00386D2C36